MRFSTLVIGSFLLVTIPLSQVVAAPPSGIPTRRPIPVITQRAEKLQAVLTRLVSLSRQRLDNYRAFLTKVQTRIDKLKADGHDVSRFTSYITLANTNIAAVDTAITHMAATFNALDVTVDMRTIMGTVRLELENVRKAFTTLHTTMAQVVDQIISEQAKGKPTPTP